MLNAIWAALVTLAILTAFGRSLALSDVEPLRAVVDAAFGMAKDAFNLALQLSGLLALWLGLLRVGEKSGAVQWLARRVRPLFARLFPSVPPDHPAAGAIVMNMAANALGLDNAATPVGIKAMRELQTLNPDPQTASREQILFLVINTSAVTIVPITIFFYRQEAGAANPTDVFIPILIATFCSTLVGFLATAWRFKIRILDRVILSWLFGLTASLGLLVYGLLQLPREQLGAASSALAHSAILLLILAFVTLALKRGVQCFEEFVQGAKEGFETAITIVPYLIAMLVAIGMFRASGALDLLMEGLRTLIASLGVDTRWVDGLPTALMKPLSGSGARGLMVETMKAKGADSFAGRLVCVIQGSTETTLYVLAVYFGSAGIKRPKEALALGLLADFGGVLGAIFATYLFFG